MKEHKVITITIRFVISDYIPVGILLYTPNQRNSKRMQYQNQEHSYPDRIFPVLPRRFEHHFYL